MPHLIIDHSPNVEERVDVVALCERMRMAMLATGLFETGGIRVRALRATHAAIADGHPRNAYIHMTLRIGAGRSLEARKAAGDAIFAAATDFLAAQFETPYFALSFAIEELDAELSWKKNAIHARLRDAGA